MVSRCLDVAAERSLRRELLSSGVCPHAVDVEDLVALARALTLLEGPQPSVVWLADARRRLLHRLRGRETPSRGHPVRDTCAVCVLRSDETA